MDIQLNFPRRTVNALAALLKPRYVAPAFCAAMVLSGCGGASAPSTRSLPLVAHARTLENGTGGFDGGGFPGQYRYMFIAQQRVSSRQLMIREAARLRAAGWGLVRTLGLQGDSAAPPAGSAESASEFKSSAAKLQVTLAPVNSLGDAEGQSEGGTGLTITRAITQAVGHDGMIFATLRSVDDP